MSAAGAGRGLGLAIAAGIALAACGGNSGPLGELKTDEVKARNKGVVVVAAELAGHIGSLACHAINFQRDGGGGGGRLNVANTQFTVPGAPAVVQLEAGRYTITEVDCTHSQNLRIQAPPGQSYGTFTLAPGEFVNIGRIVLIEHYETESTMALGANRKHVPFIQPIDPAKLAEVRKDVTASLVTRLITPGFSVGSGERQRMCEMQRRRIKNSVFAAGAPDPLVCKIA